MERVIQLETKREVGKHPVDLRTRVADEFKGPRWGEATAATSESNPNRRRGSAVRLRG